MQKLLQRLDFYGLPFVMRLNSKRTFNTSFGGFLTIITGILLVVLFIVLGDDMISRKNPKTSISQYLTKTQPHVNLSNYDLAIGIKIAQIEGNGENLINFTGGYLYSEVLYTTSYIDNETNIQSFSNLSYFDNCTNAHFIDSVEKPESYLCFNLNESFGGKIEPQTNSSSMGLYIANCKYNAPYGSPFVKCNSVMNLTNTFKKHNTNPYMVIVKYPKFYFDPWNKKQPVTIEYQTLTFPFDHNLQRIDRLFFHQSIINEDKGWWFEQIDNTSYWTVESMTHDYNYKANEDLQIRYSSSILYTLSFAMSFDASAYSRSYMKFQEVLAEVTSMIKIIAVAFEVISFFINSSLFQLFLLNAFFNFGRVSSLNSSLKSSSEKKVSSSLNGTATNFLTTKTKGTINFNNFTKEMTSGLSRINKEQFDAKKEQEKPKEKEVRFSACFAFRRSVFLVSSKSHKVRRYDFGMRIVNEQIELSNYVKALYDFVVIKGALFSKVQIEALRGMAKPNLQNDKEMEEVFGLSKDKRVVDDMSKVMELCSFLKVNRNEVNAKYRHDTQKKQSLIGIAKPSLQAAEAPNDNSAPNKNDHQ